MDHGCIIRDGCGSEGGSRNSHACAIGYAGMISCSTTLSYVRIQSSPALDSVPVRVKHTVFQAKKHFPPTKQGWTSVQKRFDRKTLVTERSLWKEMSASGHIRARSSTTVTTLAPPVVQQSTFLAKNSAFDGINCWICHGLLFSHPPGIECLLQGRPHTLCWQIPV
jgi:hypothetical protein